MKLCLHLLLLMAFASTLSAQTMLERIHEIQSFEDFQRIAIEHKAKTEVMLEARARETRGQVGEKSTPLYTSFNGSENPELLSVISLIAVAIRVDDYQYLASDLLKRGFPEEDLPILKAFMSYDKEESRRAYRAYYWRFQKEILSDTVFAGQDMKEFDWKPYRKRLEDPLLQAEAREEIRTFMWSRRLAASKAMDQVVLDRLQSFSAQALRVIVSFSYEERAKTTSVSYSSDVPSDVEVDDYINLIVYK